MKNITSKKKVFIIAAVSAMAVSFYGCGSDVQNIGCACFHTDCILIVESTVRIQ